MLFYERTHTVIKFKYKDIDAKKLMLPVPVCGNRDIITSLNISDTVKPQCNASQACCECFQPITMLKQAWELILR